MTHTLSVSKLAVNSQNEGVMMVSVNSAGGFWKSSQNIFLNLKVKSVHFATFWNAEGSPFGSCCIVINNIIIRKFITRT